MRRRVGEIRREEGGGASPALGGEIRGGEWPGKRESVGGGDARRRCDGGDGRRKQSTVQARVGSAEELSVLPCSACDFRVLHFFFCSNVFASFFVLVELMNPVLNSCFN